MSKAARKRNAGLTVATQDAADVLKTDLGQAVVTYWTRQGPSAVARTPVPTAGSPGLLLAGHVVALENLRGRFNLALGVQAAGFSQGSGLRHPGAAAGADP